jgi:hypothetical protein
MQNFQTRRAPAFQIHVGGGGGFGLDFKTFVRILINLLQTQKR